MPEDSTRRGVKNFRNGESVLTPDGPGKIIGVEMRLNTNGGRGCRQLRVRLEDGRIRHYAPSRLEKGK